MSKLKGTYKTGANMEVALDAALDPRTNWKDENELFTLSNWPNNGTKPYCYPGLIASVGEEIWVLVDTEKWNQRSGWKIVNGSNLEWDIQ